MEFFFLSSYISLPGHQHTMALRCEVEGSSENKVQVPHQGPIDSPSLGWHLALGQPSLQSTHNSWNPKLLLSISSRPPCLPEAIHTLPLLPSSDVARPVCLSSTTLACPDRSYIIWSGEWCGRSTNLGMPVYAFPLDVCIWDAKDNYEGANNPITNVIGVRVLGSKYHQSLASTKPQVS